MNFKQLITTTILSITATACFAKGGVAHKITVTGNITGMPEQTVMLEQLNANDVISVVDSAKSSASGVVKLSFMASEPGLYRLRFLQNRYIILSVDKESPVVSASWKTLDNYTITGSASSASLTKFLNEVRSRIGGFNRMRQVMDSLQKAGDKTDLATAQTVAQSMSGSFQQFITKYADTTKSEPNAIFAVRVLNPDNEKEYLDGFAKKLPARFPHTKMTADFQEFYAKVSAPAVKPVAQRVENGSMAPDLNFPTPDGNSVALSSFKGKYVLLDFWASWCGPCRGENPNVVRAYNQYKDKNFTIYSVSLDSRKEAWLAAIAKDGLTWTHVSDLKGWESAAAAKYGVQSIPVNFLIDPSGKIIAQNLRGSALAEKLAEVLK